MDEKKKELTPEQQEVLEEAFEDTAAGLEDTLAEARGILENMLESKGVNDYKDIRKRLYDDFKFQELAGVLDSLNTQLAAIKSRLDALEREEDEKVAEFFEMKWQVAGQVEEDDPDLLQQLKENAPEGVMPNPQEVDDNPMSIAWKNILGGSAG